VIDHPPAPLYPATKPPFKNLFKQVAVRLGRMFTKNFMAKSPTSAIHRSFSTTTESRGGAGLFARIGSFLVGAGLTALATEVYIFKEVREGNLEMLQKQRELEKRISALEKHK